MTFAARAAFDFDRIDAAALAAAPVEAERFRAPGVDVEWRNGAASFARDGAVVCVAWGSPRLADAPLATLARTGAARAFLALYAQRGATLTDAAGGGYALAIADMRRGVVLAAVDRFSIETLCFAVDGKRVTIADRADAVAPAGPTIDPQAVFDYLYFHMIPAPRTIFRGVSRLPGGCAVDIDARGATLRRHWRPRFDETRRGDFGALRDEFRALLRDATARNLEPGPVGAFLSGGTDSSTVAGMLREVTGARPRTYSIGFDAAGYDEMAYARLTAKHFDADHHEYYVTPADLLQSIPAVAAHHDQPFGNSSAVPAYYCAKAARADGIARMLAGDGGDELFGGNARYATQRLLEAYRIVPAPLRSAILEPLFVPRRSLTSIPGLKQLAGYVRHSSVPMPDRLQAFNLLMRLGPDAVLQPALLRDVDRGEPLAIQRATYADCDAHSLINRMLAFDWKFTLADSDLPKVRGAAAMAGVAVGYPLLDDALTDFSLTMAPSHKLRGMKLRWFFKEALRGFLPDATIAKRKHGFGLPFGVWLARQDALRNLARDALHGVADRGVADRAFVTDLLDKRLPEHPGYYGEMVWILMMLELWFAAHAPGARFV